MFIVLLHNGLNGLVNNTIGEGRLRVQSSGIKAPSFFLVIQPSLVNMIQQEETMCQVCRTHNKTSTRSGARQSW